NVRLCRIKLPVLLTSNNRKLGADKPGFTVEPFPTIEISVVTTGNPVLLVAPTFTWNIPLLGSWIVSLPLPALQPPIFVSVFAAVIASRSVQMFTLPVESLVLLTVIVPDARADNVNKPNALRATNPATTHTPAK